MTPQQIIKKLTEYGIPYKQCGCCVIAFDDYEIPGLYWDRIEHDVTEWDMDRIDFFFKPKWR
jgi:hypothetical protein